VSERIAHSTYLLIAVLFSLIAILQSTTVASPDLFGAHADVLLVLVLTWALVRSCQEVMVAAPPAALLAGLLGAGPVGAPLLILLAPVGLALFLRQRGSTNLIALGLSVGGCTLWALLVNLCSDFMVGQHTLRLAGLGAVLVGALLLNLALALLLYWPLRVMRRQQVQRRAGLSLS
jgi:hypothetical protein